MAYRLARSTTSWAPRLLAHSGICAEQMNAGEGGGVRIRHLRQACHDLSTCAATKRTGGQELRGSVRFMRTIMIIRFRYATPAIAAVRALRQVLEARLNVIGTVTAAAAGLAAILAGVNLYVSGRRELNKWRCETLVEILVVFLDASFRQAGACRTIMRGPLTQPERNRLRKEILAAHDAENVALTRLRLLAPPQVVEDAMLRDFWNLNIS
jgi:hypothetical protein